MTKKPIYIAIASLLLTQSVLSQTKTLDFYSSGSNRYSVYGKIQDLELTSNNNSILINNANSDAYVKLNNEFPYYLNLIENDLNINQILNFNKGKLISYKGNQVKIISSQNDKLIAEYDNNIIFIPLVDISIPKSFILDTQKGLKATFSKQIKKDDILFFSQPERQLNYKNSYESVIKGENIQLSHYLNINNSSLKTFENVYLNFFLSETNIQDMNMPRPMMAMAKGISSNMISVDVEPPVFDNNNVNNLKSISIKEPMTIYPNFNKIKYVDKNYSIEQYAKLQLEDKYEIYMNQEDFKNLSDLKIKGTILNDFYIERVEQIKETIKSANNIQNIIDIKINKNDILPPGKISIYETVNGQDKLIVATNIAHTENKNLEVVKGINNDIKIINVELIELNTIKDLEKYKRIIVKVKSIEIENVSDTPYIFNTLGKKTNIPANSKMLIKY